MCVCDLHCIIVHLQEVTKWLCRLPIYNFYKWKVIKIAQKAILSQSVACP